MAKYKIELQHIETNQRKQNETAAISVSKAVNDTVEKFKLDKKEWFLKKYSILR